MMNIEVLQAQWTLRRIRAEDVHVITTQLLDASPTSKSLARLAGMIGAPYWEIAPILESVFAEAHLAPVDENTARWRLAYETARQITAEEVTPLDGATSLSYLASELGLPDPLRHFVYLAADYGEGPEDRSTEETWFDTQIRETANELLALRPSLGEFPIPHDD